ncbi:hypothetical protein ROBYS_00490 [Roseobacter sp. OBYS 0001]|nr:hypothetical protein ROBYS_00490 [Roseobacter sp. OBYS 0001]
MYSYDEYTLLRLRLGRWDPEFTPKPVQVQIKLINFEKLVRRIKQLLRGRPFRVKT